MQTENKKMGNPYGWIKETNDEQLLEIGRCIKYLEEAYGARFATKNEITQALNSLRCEASDEAKIIMLSACVDPLQKKLDEIKIRKYIA